MLKWLNEKVGHKTFKREFSWAFAGVWLAGFVNALFLSEPAETAAATPLLVQTVIPIAGFVGLAAGVHYAKDKLAGKAPPAAESDDVRP